MYFDHVLQNRPKKLIYLDSFIAKDTADKKTVINFYNAMLSDEMISIYTKGLYTINQKPTYLIPPTYSSFKTLIEGDFYYQKLFQIVTTSELIPVHQE